MKRVIRSIAILGTLCGTPALATEGGASLFVPGLGVPGAGLLPPPGLYFDNTVLLYKGSLSGSIDIPIGGNIVAGVRASMWADFATGLWVTPAEIFGGRLAVSVSVPFGQPTVRASAVISGPILDRPVGISVRDSTLNFGDPVVTGVIGWNSGNWHWKFAAAASVPAGAYQSGELSNVAFNRWIGDFSLGITYLDPALGLDVSAAGGFAINGENPDTNYRSGNELHLDVGITKDVTKEFKIGVIGSHYQQITGDGGVGARVGPFKGRVSAVGGMIGYSFTAGQTPIATQFKVLREFNVENRTQGTIGWIQISFPLWMGPSNPAPPLRARF